MSLFGRNDQAVTANSTTTKESTTGAPLQTYALVKGSGDGNPGFQVSMDTNSHFGNTSPGSRANVDSTMYGNVTPGVFINNMIAGIFAVNTSMMSTFLGNVTLAFVTSPGSGYAANTANFTPTPTTNGSGASINAVANSVGKITSLNIVAAGGGYGSAPTLAIPAPAAITVYANSTTVNAASNTLLIATASSKFQIGDRFFYTVPTGNTPIVGLTGNTFYYVTFVNSTALAIANTVGGANLALTVNAVSTESHSIQGDTAKGYVDVSINRRGIAHSGWVLRREGTGGRAGRVHYEVLVASGSIGAQSAAYGTPATVSGNTAVGNLV